MTIAAPRLPHDPLRGPEFVESSDTETLAQAFERLVAPAHFESLSDRLSGLVTGVTLGSVRLCFFRLGAPVRLVVAPTRASVCWVIPVAPTRYDSGRGMQLSDDPFALSQQARTLLLPHAVRGAVVITTTAERLGRHLTELTGVSLPEGFEVHPDRPCSTRAGLVDTAWRYAARLLDVTAEISPSTGAALEHLLLTGLLHEVPSNVDAALLGTTRRPASSKAHATRAIDWVTERLQHPISISQWASAVGVSPRYLQRIFKDVHGVTPHQYLMQMRLEHARSLLHAGGASSVSEAANKSGFAHLGRFAATYREAFGEYPSEVIRQRNPN